jgi:hypothetical protein
MRAPYPPLLDAPALYRVGLPEYERGASPAAGEHFAPALDGSYFYRLLSLHVRLVTDATAADRTVVIEYRDTEDSRYDLSGNPVTQDESTTTDWIFSVFTEHGEWPVDDTILVPLHPVLLLPTHDFRVFVDNVQAGDQLSRIRFMFERFYTTGQPVLAPFLDAAGVPV